MDEENENGGGEKGRRWRGGRKKARRWLRGGKKRDDLGFL
jgi:hypothetical protein